MDYASNTARLLGLMHISTVLILTTFVCIDGLQHPRSRLSRSDEISVHVSVRPRYVEFGPNDIIAISCRAKGGKALNDVPFITFYRKFGEDTHLPLSSGDPGVLVRSQPVSPGGSLFNKTIKTLYLGKESWITLNYGDNLFYCRGSNNRGRSQAAYFVVRKVWRNPWAANIK